MSTYELDDELVREFLGTLHESEDEMPSGKLGKNLQTQLTLPAPTKIGAVVRASYNTTSVFTRWGTDEQVDRPWIDAEDGEHVQTERLGRITEVLSEGVDL